MTHLLDQHSYNVAVAELMIFFNKLKGFKDLKGTVEYHQSLSTLCTLLSPLAPHIASELWEMLNEAGQRLNLPKSQVNSSQERISASGTVCLWQELWYTVWMIHELMSSHELYCLSTGYRENWPRTCRLWEGSMQLQYTTLKYWNTDSSTKRKSQSSAHE